MITTIISTDVGVKFLKITQKRDYTKTWNSILTYCRVLWFGFIMGSPRAGLAYKPPFMLPKILLAELVFSFRKPLSIDGCISIGHKIYNQHLYIYLYLIYFVLSLVTVSSDNFFTKRVTWYLNNQFTRRWVCYLFV